MKRKGDLTLKPSYLLINKTAELLYNQIKDLPIIDYHSHLSITELNENKPFLNIGEMLINHDHYIYRLMRAASIDEFYITGQADYNEKFVHLISALEFAGNSPLYQWIKIQLSFYFNINLALTSENAQEILKLANNQLKSKKFTPISLLEKCNVSYVATTDDPISNLEEHKTFNLKNNSFKVAPTFRPDNLLLINNSGFINYLIDFSNCCGVKIENFETFLEQIEQRIIFFKENNCKFADSGIMYFPNNFDNQENAKLAFETVLKNDELSDNLFNDYLGFMFTYLAKLYHKHDIIMQLHLGALRNINPILYNTLGADSGGDAVGTFSCTDLATFFNTLNKDNTQPKTIVYTLNISLLEQLITICGSFRNIFVGAAWWFNDHTTGIKKTINALCDYGYIGSFPGMLTDSRSFASAVRHDYFRRILSSTIAQWEDYDLVSAQKLAKKLAYLNIKEMIGEDL